MQFVKDPPRNPVRAGLVELQEPLGHLSSPAWLCIPKMAAQGCPHLKKAGGDTPASSSSPAALGTTATPQGRGGWRGITP